MENKDLGDVIITALCDRKGFENWWHEIDEETQTEIMEELGQIVKENL